MTLNDYELKTLDCCRRISDANPERDIDAEKALHELGFILNNLGGFELMQTISKSVTDKSIGKKTEDGNAYYVALITNNSWNGIGKWTS